MCALIGTPEPEPEPEEEEEIPSNEEYCDYNEGHTMCIYPVSQTKNTNFPWEKRDNKLNKFAATLDNFYINSYLWK